MDTHKLATVSVNALAARDHAHNLLTFPNHPLADRDEAKLHEAFRMMAEALGYSVVQRPDGDVPAVEAEAEASVLPYDDAMQRLADAAAVALRASRNTDGAPTLALSDMLADVESLIDHGCTEGEMNEARLLYEGAKLAGLVGGGGE